MGVDVNDECSRPRLNSRVYQSRRTWENTEFSIEKNNDRERFAVVFNVLASGKIEFMSPPIRHVTENTPYTQDEPVRNGRGFGLQGLTRTDGRVSRISDDTLVARLVFCE